MHAMYLFFCETQRLIIIFASLPYRVHDDSHGLWFGLHERILGNAVFAELADLVERQDRDVSRARGLGSAILGLDHVLCVDDELQ
jgi:hypothetical protein